MFRPDMFPDDKQHIVLYLVFGNLAVSYRFLGGGGKRAASKTTPTAVRIHLSLRYSTFAVW